MDDELANLALKMGKTIGVIPLANHPSVQHFLRLQQSVLELAARSGKSLEFVKHELARYPGPLDALWNFWRFHGHFPSEMEVEDV